MTEFEKEAASRRFFFRKENRLLQRADFLRVYTTGRAFRRRLVHVFIVHEDPIDGQYPPTRIGITATRKTGKSVKRNRARRLIRESFRMSLPDMEPGYSMVVNVTRATSGVSFANVDAQLRSIWKEAGVLP